MVVETIGPDTAMLVLLVGTAFWNQRKIAGLDHRIREIERNVVTSKKWRK